MKFETDHFAAADKLGFYGDFGGAFIPELLRKNVDELQNYFGILRDDPDFIAEFKDLLKHYVGRPTPLYFAANLSRKYNAKIYLKREDLCHTGAHKINNAIGQALLAKRMGKKRIVAETGAGQHGVATATACALLNLECIVHMGAVDMQRQAANVQRMKILGAEVIPAKSGSQTLKDATNEAIRYWINNPDSYYLIGSVVGPHPYPEMVAYLQSVISDEIKQQLLQQEGRSNPDKVIACVGGGSNAAGAFYHFYNEEVELLAVEAAGEGLESGKSAATSILGKPGVLHGSLSLLMQDENGQVIEPHSISAGLDYPGIGPMHAASIQSGRTTVQAIRDDEAVDALFELAKLEGIIPALESAHALAALRKIDPKPHELIVINLSGRGDKDMSTILKHFSDESI